MMKIFKHHPIDNEIWDFWKEDEREAIQESLEDLDLSPGNTWLLRGEAFKWALRHWSEHHDRDHLLKYLRLSVYAGEFHFWKAKHPGETRTFEWEEWKTEITAPPEGKTPSIHPYLMIEPLYLAIILRDQKALNTFLSFKDGDFQDIGLQGDSYGKYWSAARLSILRGDGNGAALLKKAYQLTDPKYIKIEGLDKIFNFVVPQMNLWVALLQRDEKLFNRYFVEAHELFFDWVKEEEHWEWDVRYYLWEHLTAVAALAFDNGIRLTEIESDYTPRWLIEGDL